MAFLEIHDGSPDNSLMGIVKSLDYKYQAEMWIDETKEHEGTDGAPVRWDLREGSKEEPGQVVHRWRRQPDGEILEVPVL